MMSDMAKSCLRAGTPRFVDLLAETPAVTADGKTIIPVTFREPISFVLRAIGAAMTPE